MATPRRPERVREDARMEALSLNRKARKLAALNLATSKEAEAIRAFGIIINQSWILERLLLTMAEDKIK